MNISESQVICARCGQPILYRDELVTFQMSLFQFQLKPYHKTCGMEETLTGKWRLSVKRFPFTSLSLMQSRNRLHWLSVIVVLLAIISLLLEAPFPLSRNALSILELIIAVTPIWLTLLGPQSVIISKLLKQCLELENGLPERPATGPAS